MNYLLYVEFAAENLQFYLWFKDYVKRFDALPESEKALAQPIDTEKQDVDSAVPKIQKSKTGVESSTYLAGNAFSEKNKNLFSETTRDENDSAWSDVSTTASGQKDHRTTTANAFEQADVKYQPFTIQPYREEVSRVIATYISDGSSRQLNLSSKERAELLRNLAATTHPSAFIKVLRTVEWTLKHQAHPNFIRWTICNGNRSRWLFARGLGISLVSIGVVLLIVLTISSLNRAYRLIAALPILLGISTMCAAWKGMCVVLHGMHHRHLRPWELFSDDSEAASEFDMRKGSWDSFGSRISYEDEPWVAKYEQRNIVRKIFDREVWVQEPALRQIQDTIFLQSLLVAAVITAVVVGAICGVPRGNRF